MTRRQPSLKRPLIVQPLIFQFFILIVSFSVLLALLIRLDSGGHYTEETVAVTVARAVTRQPDGSLAVRRTPALAALRVVNPSLWFVAVDERGRRVSFGPVPDTYRSLARNLDGIAWADLRDRNPPYRLAAVIRKERGHAGDLTIMGQGKLTSLGFVVLLAANLAVIPIFLLLALATIIVTPWIVRRSLAGVARIAREAERIDVGRRGIRLTEAEVPKEIGPLVRAVNDALTRLDDGYERQRRFIASAAHELRTPIAILRVKIEAATEPGAQRLVGEVARLSTLAEQLLDLHRLDQEAQREPIDLAALARRVAADLAPLLIAADKAIEVVVEQPVTITGDPGAIERVLTNLVQNGVEHGGTRVIVRVGDAGFEVEDDGPGIPASEREQVFEPFHRLRPRATGAGLGLSLVRQVVERHRGQVSILDAAGGGGIVRVRFA